MKKKIFILTMLLLTVVMGVQAQKNLISTRLVPQPVEPL